MLPAGPLSLVVESRPGSKLSVESSTDLAIWSPLQSLTNWMGVAEILDYAAANATQRFNRAIKL
jgi:hypothetical protein